MKKETKIKKEIKEYLLAIKKYSKSPIFITSFILVIAFCLYLSFSYDKKVALFFKYEYDPKIISFFKFITDIGLGIWWYILAISGYLYFMSKAGVSKTKDMLDFYILKAQSFYFLFFSILSSSIVVTILKIIIGRYRPRYLFKDDLYGLQPFNLNFAMNSFPSGHSQTIWAIMTSLCFVFPRLSIIFIPTALIVSLSRVIITVHYLSDVVMGAYIATTMSIWAKNYFLEKSIDVRFNKK